MMKDEKFGHGGQKKRSKWNTAESSADISDFKTRFGKPNSKFRTKTGKRVGTSGGKNKKHRPGKQRRANMKNRQKRK